MARRGGPTVLTGAATVRVADIAGGVLIVVLAAGIWTWLGPRAGAGSPVRGVGCALLGVVGTASVVDGISPMTCAPSADEICRRSTRTAPLLAQLGDLHTGVARFGVACGATVLLAGVMITGLTLLGGPGIGTLERVQVLVVAGWIATISCVLVRHRPGV